MDNNSRRDFMKAMGVGAASLMLTGSVSAKPGKKQPNRRRGRQKRARGPTAIHHKRNGSV
ncbi:twin-arginine translocation signal domain-containing protein [Halomarina oriensis]